MEKLCIHYGTLIGYVDSKPFYDMPSPSALTAPDVEAHLRQLGFGYRAKYLRETAVMISRERDVGWLDSLRNPESPLLSRKPSSAGNMLADGREGYRTAHAELLSLQGVGPKVADCVCLMGLGWGEAVPVDTHGKLDHQTYYRDRLKLIVWQIAQRDYSFGKGKYRSLTSTTYNAIANHFRNLWGKEAGWAHSVLFAADLRALSEQQKTKVEITEIKQETLDEKLGQVIIEKEVKLETKVKLEPGEDDKRTLLVTETERSTRAKRRRTS